MATLPELLKTMVEMDGSDLHITTNTPPQVRVHGKLQRSTPPLLPAETKQLAYSVLTDAQKKRFEETLELDFSFGIKGLARFRCNVFNQRGAVGAVYRLIPEKIGLSASWGCRRSGDARRAAARPGARHRADRQRQVDDAGGDARQDQHRAPRAHPHDRGPDRVHPPAQGLPRQPARGARDTTASRTRCAPRCARTRTSCSSARCATSRRSRRRCDRRDRPPDVRHAAHQLGGADDQPHHRRLPGAPAGADPHAALVRARGHRLPALLPAPTAAAAWWSLEILVPTPAIRNLIREDKVHQIYSSMQTGQEKLGMQTMNQSLATLYMKRLITLETALARRPRTSCGRMIRRGVGVVPGAGWGAAAGAERRGRRAQS